MVQLGILAMIVEVLRSFVTVLCTMPLPSPGALRSGRKCSRIVVKVAPHFGMQGLHQGLHHAQRGLMVGRKVPRENAEVAPHFRTHGLYHGSNVAPHGLSRARKDP